MGGREPGRIARRRLKGRWIVIPVALLGLGLMVAPRVLPKMKRPPAVPAAATRPIRIEVLNGCGVPGAVEKIATRLRSGNFIVERMGDAPEFGHTEDLVIARTADRDAMLEVARWLNCPARLVQRNETSDVDVTVIVGRPH